MKGYFTTPVVGGYEGTRFEDIVNRPTGANNANDLKVQANGNAIGTLKKEHSIRQISVYYREDRIWGIMVTYNLTDSKVTAKPAHGKTRALEVKSTPLSANEIVLAVYGRADEGDSEGVIYSIGFVLFDTVTCVPRDVTPVGATGSDAEKGTPFYETKVCAFGGYIGNDGALSGLFFNKDPDNM